MMLLKKRPISATPLISPFGKLRNSSKRAKIRSTKLTSQPSKKKSKLLRKLLKEKI
jgi:hypothetical protein